MNYRMEHNDIANAVLYSMISFLSIGVGFINWTGLLAALPSISHTVAIGAGLMAIRHWYFATKKINRKK